MKRLSRVFAVLSGIGFLAMAFLGVSDVIGTQFLDSPIPGTYEITMALMVTSLFFGVALAQAERKHVRVEILVSMAPPALKRFLAFLSELSITVLFAAIAWFGWAAFWRSVVVDEYTQSILELRLWPPRLALALGATLLVIQALVGLYNRFVRRAADTD